MLARTEMRRVNATLEPNRAIVVKRRVFWGAALSIGALVLWTIIGPEAAGHVLSVVTLWIGRWFGWFYILLGTATVVFVFYIALSRYGDIRLSSSDSRPEYSNLAWASMLFAAGIGTDILFFSVAEPVSQFMKPPQGTPQSVTAAEQAPVWAIFHYGITGWAMYALMGLALGYFAYRRGRPIAARTALEPIFGEKRMAGIFGDVVDIAAILGAVFGVVTTLGIGVVQINVGLEIMFGIQRGLATQTVLIFVAVLMAIISAVSGVSRGIRILSQINVIAAIALVGWVLATGRPEFLMNAMVSNIGDLVAYFPQMTMDTMAYSDVEIWKNAWTLFFWAWWVAWASFVGMFLARISRGRTIRQFVFGVMTIPFLYVVMWISIFGNRAIDYILRADDGPEFARITLNTPELGFYHLLQQVPGGTAIVLLATAVGFLFYVTSADSGALVVANLCSVLPSPTTDARPWLRVFWASLTGVLTVGMLFVGGIPALQSATVIMGLPFAFVIALTMVGFYKEISRDRKTMKARSVTYSLGIGSLAATSFSQNASWKERLAQLFGTVTPQQAQNYLDRVVRQALEAVVTEIDKQGAYSAVVSGDDNYVYPETDRVVYDHLTLHITGTQGDFYYRTISIDGPAMVYGTQIPTENDRSTRIEVQTSLGEEPYDIMGYSAEAIICDVINQFERFMRDNESGEF